MPAILTHDGEVIDYTDVVKEVRSPHIGLSIDRSSVIRTVDVTYTKAEKFAQAVVGYPVLTSFVDDNDDTFAYISRKLPWRFPLIRNRGIWCCKCDWDGYASPSTFSASTFNVNLMRGFDPNGNAFPVYENARCQLVFETPTYDTFNDDELQVYVNSYTEGNPFAPDYDYDEGSWFRYVTIIVRPQGELFTIQGAANNGYFAGGVLLGAGAYPIGQDINKMIGTKTITVTWHQVPIDAVPDRSYNPNGPNLAIDFCIGRVNDRFFNGYPQGTLLMLGAEIQPHKDCRGDRIYDITYTFKQFQPRANPTRVIVGGGAPIEVFAGHNHTFIPKPRLAGTTTPGGAAAVADWYEMIADSNLAILGLHSNFLAKAKGVNPYDYGNFANLFRPATYIHDVVP